MNIKGKITKLQDALCARGIHVFINQRQHYSEKARRIVTRYIVREKDCPEPLVETYSPIEVIMTLADRLSGGDGE